MFSGIAYEVPAATGKKVYGNPSAPSFIKTGNRPATI
jgi:hypothetical protein